MKYFLIIVVSLFLVNCDNNDNDNDLFGGIVDSGSSGSLAYSKRCQGGSFQVYKSSVVGHVGYSQISSLPVGSSVSVKGSISSSPCHSGSSVTFTCEGTVAIGTNRTIQCTSGSIFYGGTSSFQTTKTTAPSNLLPNLLGGSHQSCDPLIDPLCTGGNSIHSSGSTLYNNHSSRNLTSGQIHTYDNGTRAAVSLTFPHPSSLPSFGGQCSAGFLCP